MPTYPSSLRPCHIHLCLSRQNCDNTLAVNQDQLASLVSPLDCLAWNTDLEWLLPHLLLLLVSSDLDTSLTRACEVLSGVVESDRLDLCAGLECLEDLALLAKVKDVYAVASRGGEPDAVLREDQRCDWCAGWNVVGCGEFESLGVVERDLAWRADSEEVSVWVVGYSRQICSQS